MSRWLVTRRATLAAPAEPLMRRHKPDERHHLANAREHPVDADLHAIEFAVHCWEEKSESTFRWSGDDVCERSASLAVTYRKLDHQEQLLQCPGDVAPVAMFNDVLPAMLT